jgi:hypothetical protein
MKHFNTVQRSACLLCLLNIQATAIANLVSVYKQQAQRRF